MIKVQAEAFQVSSEYAQIVASTRAKAGAVCFFVGLVRDFGDHNNVVAIELEHYPGMTEKALQKLCDEARSRWPLDEVRLIHRIGRLDSGDEIVFVATASAHRSAAFASCEFIMDALKTEAPFWKKEIRTDGGDWVEAKESDQQRRQKW